MRYKSEDINLLIDSLKIEDIVGEFVELKKTGANYKGLCPFHPDTTPSFMVSPSKNICKCFVCGAGGNPISFYSQYKKISFGEAVSELSKRYNISIKEIKSNNKVEENYDKYYKIMGAAHEFYKEKIFSNQGREALEYLGNRQINPKIIKDNELGFAPNSWNDLSDYLINKGFEFNDIIALGLVKQGDSGKVYDVFRNRVIFPIYSIRGDIIGFGGRTLEKDKEIPKYINSPDTPIFKKGKNLYGLERYGIIKKKNYAMLMEGYMDVLSTYLHGIDVALAPLGTALTEEQAVILKRYTSNVILAFDSDGAGQVATERAGLILKNAGFNIRVLELKGAKDPDEYLKSFGKEEFLKCVKNSVEIFDFLFNMYSKQYDLSTTIGQEKFVDRFKEFFNCVDTELAKMLYLDKLSKEIGIGVETLKKELIDKNKKITRKKQYDVVNIEKQQNNNIINRVERDTILIILKKLEYFKYFVSKNIRGTLIIKLFEYLNSHQQLTNSEIVKSFTNEVELTPDEEDTWRLIICSTIQDDEMEMELLRETFKSWFNSEIVELMEYIHTSFGLEGLGKQTKLKLIQRKIPSTNDFDMILKLYEEFKTIASF